MCGRFTLVGIGNLEELFGVELPEECVPRYNIAPSQKIVVIPNGEKRNVALFQWGLIPPWANDPSIGNRMINARSETVDTKPAFRAAFRNKRCLILADGFYEWKNHEDVGGKGKKKKAPYYIHRPDKKAFALAGLWSTWTSPAGEVIHSCTIITGEAAPEIEAIHHRMPIVVESADYDRWLHGEVKSREMVEDILSPLARGEERIPFEFYSVSNLVNGAQNDHPNCLEIRGPESESATENDEKGKKKAGSQLDLFG